MADHNKKDSIVGDNGTSNKTGFSGYLLCNHRNYEIIHFYLCIWLFFPIFLNIRQIK